MEPSPKTESQVQPPPNPESTPETKQEKLLAAVASLKARTERIARQEKLNPGTHERQCPECKRIVLFFVTGVCLPCWTNKAEGTRTWTPCPRCGKEWSKLKEEGICIECHEADQKQKEQEQKTNRKIKGIFGSTEAVDWYTLSNFDRIIGTGEAYDACQAFDYRTDNLYLYGPCGRGKTHLAYAVGVKYLLQGQAVVSVSVRELFNRFRMKKPEEEASEMQELTNADILILDDLGVSRSTDFSLELICEILNKRTLKLKNGLIVTSNLSLDEVAKKNQDDRLSSRLNGMCQVIQIVSSVDYRAEGT
jgi:DNA replication protein DnaC